MIEFITPDWPAPAGIKALSTTRIGGVSQSPFDSLNLGDHVGDDPRAVEQNRQRLETELQLPSPLKWLQQVHGRDVANAETAHDNCQADAIISRRAGRVCAVLTADCLPLLLCDRQARCVAAVHAGWRGLANGIIEATLEQMALPSDQLLAWMGPAIGPTAFEVGDEVRQCFMDQDHQAASHFKPSKPGFWLADIYGLARQRLQAQGIGFIGGGDHCTVNEQQRFFSYRRDGTTGRMATLIWLDL